MAERVSRMIAMTLVPRDKSCQHTKLQQCNNMPKSYLAAFPKKEHKKIVGVVRWPTHSERYQSSAMG
jgi:hypothetical protein